MITNKKAEIVGRINLFSIHRNPCLTGELGYRIGEPYIRKGIATKSVAALLEKVKKENKLTRINAKTTSHNIGSQRTLQKNGFFLHSVEKDAAQLNGQKYELYYYCWSNDSTII
ncbi:GNAT family N-acetyltransferase [Halalkalibacter krulwichiae]|uniref:Ribosomal-protein-L7/L12-serine acetyltransferase n=1 Tax=Halalkalibacter krulwichiae TaxID=199441 RepID=A0A1Y9THL8_9BACI|nr:GNAT family N-acetyltransferase [Halalkalibacter krulwichiae]ARK28595.1 ribosomal-protein-L7/L12-serine acetyltransferase [Halalkalibacter krulwichiae]